ncbi:NUDIX domain-containing protein [Alysiella filiformis]|uniref:8-oxo-dGTP diphosphatase n=1 Tax=Alysiella filiformis DSM 16848 TaxID=1120981 RepID=A0A286ED76_9NEIS|nr:NUDIX domain-containing protein [Alysiella filiformis]QMT31164.1 NUDIX domain-containing protein [Alysiella filiformis]UBQ55842.1 NUDIX domain-containing protein [Alysiella filiformis DSM 16848]SOD68853.1 mutator mutT protein [Alysiella filiformis DSM 16848]
MKPILNVVAGIVFNAHGEILLSSRPEGKAYAGYWEFAGGKIEAGETHLAALKREFFEELGVQIHDASAWLSPCYEYEHAIVNLHFYLVQAGQWAGEIQAKEGQNFTWRKPNQVADLPILPANYEIIQALCDLNFN